MQKNYEFANIGKFDSIKDKQYTLPDSKKVLVSKSAFGILKNTKKYLT